MREEYSDRKLFLGMALSPQNNASPSSATSAMMWLLRSIAHSLSASEARSACAEGTMREPGSLAACASASLSSRTRSGTNRNSPPCDELARAEHEVADIGDGLCIGTGPDGTLLVEPARQGRKAFGGEHLAHRGGAQRRSLFLERLADLIDRVV